MNREAFLTGSWAYGMPTKESDIDLVIRCDGSTFEHLMLVDEPEKQASDKQVSRSLRFGKLNLIVCLNDETYEQWRSGTEELKSRGEIVSRDEAVAVFKRIRKGEGVNP